MRLSNRWARPKPSSFGAPESSRPPHPRSKCKRRWDRCRAGSWICSAIPEIGAAFPVMIDGNRSATSSSRPTSPPKCSKNGSAFSPSHSSAIALTLLTGIIAYFTVRRRALHRSSISAKASAHARRATTTHLILPLGRRKSATSAEKANELARTLSRLSHDNRSLLHKIVSLQDDERRDMARDLHDELGPLLFGIRANAVALHGSHSARAGRSRRHRAGASCNRSRRCSRPTAASSTGCGRSTSRSWASRRASRPCCRMPVRRRPASS